MLIRMQPTYKEQTTKKNNMTNVKLSNVKSTHESFQNDINDTTHNHHLTLLLCAKRVKLAHVITFANRWVTTVEFPKKLIQHAKRSATQFDRQKTKSFNRRSKMAKKAKWHPEVCHGRLIAVRRPQLRMQIFPRSKLRPLSPPINRFNIAIRQREYKIGWDD